MFINLHVHSAEGSLLDSILRVKEIAKYAKDNGQPAIALSDHGYMYASLNHVIECQKLGIKPITANEIYECDDHLQKSDTKNNLQPRYHLLLIVKNQIGKENLYKIVSEAATNGFYKKPRVSVQWIKENNLGSGIICLTACQAGRVSRYLEQDRKEEAIQFINLLKETFDYIALEIQSHPTESQIQCNQRILDLALEINMPYVITTDAHMLKEDQLDAHSIFVEIGENREVGESYVGCHLQTENDIYRYLGSTLPDNVIRNGIEESFHIAEMVSSNIDYELNKGTVMPKAHIPDGYTVESYFRHLVNSTFDEKFGHMDQEEQIIRRNRIESEIAVLKELDFLNYLLIQYEFCNECDKRGIPRGYSRGSAANCLCAFMLNITQIDSVRFNLDFSRFANLGRKGSVADIDLDLSKARRQEAVQVLCDIFGSDHVAPMATFNTLSTKVAIRDIGKVLNEKKDSPYYGKIPYSIRNEVAGMIPTIKTLNELGESEDKDALLKDLIGNNPKLDSIQKKYPLWFSYVMQLEGLPKSRGRHASGTLLTPEPIIHYCPLCLDNEKNIMSMFEMHICQDTENGLGLCKEDLLGLETLDIIDNALKLANMTWKDVDINHLNINDSEVFKIYREGNTIGVFQFESAEAKDMCINAKVDTFEDIVVVNASNRPGTKNSFPEYCSNKLNPESINSIHPDLDKLFKDTHSILLYQEDALHLFAYAGFPEDKQDVARRAIGKKKKEVMASLYEDLYAGLKNKNWTESQIEAVWELLLKQAEYSFNRGHSVSYGLLSYLCAWLKVYYPVEFMASLLTVKAKESTKMNMVMSECKRIGIKILPPSINKSNLDFTITNEGIRFGLSAIKGCGDTLMSSIIQERISNGPFVSMNDFINRVSISKSQVVIMIKSGAIPCKDKRLMIIQFLKSQYTRSNFREVKTYGTKQELLLKWGIDCDEFKTGKKIDKDKVLEIYNKKRKEKFFQNEKERYHKYIDECTKKYLDNEEFWEFETLQFFVSNGNPFEDAIKYCVDLSKAPVGQKCVVPGIIAKVQKKKSKSGKQFAFINLYGIELIEGIVWPNVLKKYNEFISKGNKIVTLAVKEAEDKIVIEKIQSYDKWIKGKNAKI